MAVAATGVLVNGATAWLFSRNEGDLNLRGAFLHMAGDALVSLGVVVSGALTSLLITLVILVASWSLFGASLHLMVDGVPAGIDPSAVRQRLQGLPGVAAVHDLHVWALASSENALTAHLVRSEPADHAGVAVADGPGASDLLERAHATLREHYGIQHATLQIETTQQAARCVQRGACGLS
jgi:cobalt-zinc-cadmium efflux system protein